MAKLVDAPDLGSGDFGRVGSSPIRRTIETLTACDISQSGFCCIAVITISLPPLGESLAVYGGHHLENFALTIIKERIATDRAAHTAMIVVADTFAQVGSMVEKIILPFIVYYRCMISTTVYWAEYHALIGVWSQRRTTGGIYYSWLMPSERSIGIRHVIDAISLMHPYGFKEILDTLNDMYLAIV